MLEITTEIEINASPQRVWNVLVDFAGHSGWNPFVRAIQGRPEVGERLTVSIQPPGGKGMTFRPIVLEATPHQEFRWRGKFLLPGLFDGEHYFRIVPLAADKVRFQHGERFSGILVPLFQAGLLTSTKQGFEAMNRALKDRSEGPEQ